MLLLPITACRRHSAVSIAPHYRTWPPGDCQASVTERNAPAREGTRELPNIPVTSSAPSKCSPVRVPIRWPHLAHSPVRHASWRAPIVVGSRFVAGEGCDKRCSSGQQRAHYRTRCLAEAGWGSGALFLTGEIAGAGAPVCGSVDPVYTTTQDQWSGEARRAASSCCACLSALQVGSSW